MPEKKIHRPECGIQRFQNELQLAKIGGFRICPSGGTVFCLKFRRRHIVLDDRQKTYHKEYGKYQIAG